MKVQNFGLIMFLALAPRVLSLPPSKPLSMIRAPDDPRFIDPIQSSLTSMLNSFTSISLILVIPYHNPYIRRFVKYAGFSPQHTMDLAREIAPNVGTVSEVLSAPAEVKNGDLKHIKIGKLPPQLATADDNHLTAISQPAIEPVHVK